MERISAVITAREESPEDIEFNQVAMLGTTFEEPVARALEELLLPLAPDVTDWLANTDFRWWRSLVQANRSRIELHHRGCHRGEPAPREHGQGRGDRLRLRL